MRVKQQVANNGKRLWVILNDDGIEVARTEDRSQAWWLADSYAHLGQIGEQDDGEQLVET